MQFTDDPALTEAIQWAEEIELEDVRLRIISRTDLLHEKLRAAADPARRRSKRLQDLADAQALLEATPALVQELTPAERLQLNGAVHVILQKGAYTNESLLNHVRELVRARTLVPLLDSALLAEASPQRAAPDRPVGSALDPASCGSVPALRMA